MKKTFAIGMGGAAGQGVATPGDVFAKIFSRAACTRMLTTPISRSSAGRHTFLTIRTGAENVTNIRSCGSVDPSRWHASFSAS